MNKTQAYQGDIGFVPLEHLGKSATDVKRDHRLRPHERRLLIQEGEITGHHHGVWFMPQPVHLRDDAVAYSLTEASPVIVTAQLFQDDDLTADLTRAGKLLPGAPVIGYLIADADITVQHASEDGKATNEHADITRKSGGYVVLGKREQTAGDVQRVQD